MGSNPRSAPPPPNRLDRQAAKEAIMGMATVSAQPLLVGVASMRLGSYWTIDRTEVLFQELEEEGLLRRITAGEMRTSGLREGYVVAGVTPRRAV